MKIHNDPIAKNLARLLGHTGDYERSGFQKRVVDLCNEIEKKYGRKIDKTTILTWMIDGRSHRYPSPDLLSLIGKTMNINPFDLWVDPDRFIKIEGPEIGLLKKEVIELLLKMDDEKIRPILEIIKFSFPGNAVADDQDSYSSQGK